MGRAKQVVARSVGDKSAVWAFIHRGGKAPGRTRVMNDRVTEMVVVMVRTATRVPRLALLPFIRFQDAALMLVMMCVMADMLRYSRTLLVLAIRRQNSRSPL
ncbi:MAG: hypothetical protein CVU19_01365 [Betaproteobacteria bacterium HGW-Betaproteobacteria-13]|nr:MAG: hypothetical protein CVU19_01365 [Betaproteobacteria bacterium HGW-Betaproteobacteria-13]